MAELDELLEERATKEKTLRELQDKEVTLRRDLNDLNRELDLQSSELHTLMETVCAKRTAMEKRIREKQKRVEELREEFSVVVRDERRNASYRIIANESRFLKRRISQQKEVRNSLRKQVDEIRDHKKMVKIRCKMMVSEERALWMSISERVKRMAEHGHPLDVGHTMVSTTALIIILIVIIILLIVITIMIMTIMVMMMMMMMMMITGGNNDIYPGSQLAYN